MALRKSTMKTLKKLAPVADRVFSYRPVKGLAIRAARLYLARYAKFGEANEVTIPRLYQGPWEFMLDTPKMAKSTAKQVYVSGWFVPTNDTTEVAMRLRTPSDKTIKLDYDIDRSDVASTLRQRYRKTVADRCGFGTTITIKEDGAYVIEAKLGNNEWQRVSRIEMSYSPDCLPKDVLNPALSQNMAEHLNLIDSKKRYFHETANTIMYDSSDRSDSKLVAFYLPQFHPFPENDKWWGKGFTEWTNVADSIPRYVGHEQPKLPADLGFYDLRYEDNLKDQISLAKQHGIYGFCFYYYWFSGKRLLERPLDIMLEHKEWDFNFMICWANENWTRRWDGRQHDVLIQQEHRPDDSLEFIKDVEHILTDARYIRVDGKPVLVVYRAEDLDDTSQYAEVWRNYMRQKHGLELHLVAVRGFSHNDPTSYGFDRGLEFAPLSLSGAMEEPIPSYDISGKALDIRFTGAVYDYRSVARTFPKIKPRHNVYRSVMPSWDNDARKKGSGGIFQGANPDLYGHWLSQIIAQQQAASSRVDKEGDFIFINAWNEWAEGAYLEPDSLYGHSYLNRTSEVLAAHSAISANRDNFPLYGLDRKPSTKLAVVIHLYYDDFWPVFQERLQVFADIDYDLFVTIPLKNAGIETDIKAFKADAQVIASPNRGRDVLPFVHLARRLKEVGYEYVLKFHTKKSMHRADGNVWMEDMLNKLIPTTKHDVKKLLRILADKSTGVIGPDDHYISLSAYFGSNKEKMVEVLDAIVGPSKADAVVKNLDEYGFFAGTMFWARLDAIGPVLDEFYQAEDFDSERGQVDGTLAHALERAFSLVPEIQKKKLYATNAGLIREIDYTLKPLNDYSYAINTGPVEKD